MRKDGHTLAHRALARAMELVDLPLTPDWTGRDRIAALDVFNRLRQPTARPAASKLGAAKRPHTKKTAGGKDWLEQARKQLT